MERSSVETMVDLEGVGNVREPVLDGLHAMASTPAVVFLAQFYGRGMLQMFGKLVPTAAQGMACTSLASRQIENVTKKTPHRAKASMINMFDLYAKYGKDILQLRNDTLRFLRNEQIYNFGWLIDSCFSPEFSKERWACAQVSDQEAIRDGIRHIVRCVISPERIDLVCDIWLSVMDRVGPLAFYGVLKYVFNGLD